MCDSVDRPSGDQWAATKSSHDFIRALIMKKTVFALVAVASLGLAACGGTETNTAANTAGETTNAAVEDVANASNASEAATVNALDADANATLGNVAVDSNASVAASNSSTNAQ
jgi:ABC-type glycerol-3-phosphate transport system substrate-binding protein